MSKNNLFYSQEELLNTALHNNGIEVYDIVVPKDDKEHIYAIVNEINKRELEILKKCGFDFYCINPHIENSDNIALWIQFTNGFD